MLKRCIILIIYHDPVIRLIKLGKYSAVFPTKDGALSVPLLPRWRLRAVWGNWRSQVISPLSNVMGNSCRAVIGRNLSTCGATWYLIPPKIDWDSLHPYLATTLKYHHSILKKADRTVLADNSFIPRLRYRICGLFSLLREATFPCLVIIIPWPWLQRISAYGLELSAIKVMGW